MRSREIDGAGEGCSKHLMRSGPRQSGFSEVQLGSRGGGTRTGSFQREDPSARAEAAPGSCLASFAKVGSAQSGQSGTKKSESREVEDLVCFSCWGPVGLLVLRVATPAAEPSIAGGLANSWVTEMRCTIGTVLSPRRRQSCSSISDEQHRESRHRREEGTFAGTVEKARPRTRNGGRGHARSPAEGRKTGRDPLETEKS